MLKKQFLKLLCLLHLVLFSSLSVAQTVTIAIGEWPPYFSSKVAGYGYLPQIIKAAFALEGVQVEFGFFPWARSKKLVSSGSWDITAGWSYTAQRARNFYYSDSVLNSPTVFFYLKKNKFTWERYDDLKDLEIGTTLSYFYSEEFTAAAAKKIFNTQVVSSEIVNFQKLLYGRIDLFPADINVGFQQLSDHFSQDQQQQITYSSKVVRHKSYHLLFSKRIPGNIELLKLFDRGYRKLRDSGELRQYTEKMGAQVPSLVNE